MGRQVKVKVKKQSLAGRKLLILIYPPLKICRALLTEGLSAMDGRLSFVEQGRESKRPGNEVMLLNIAINN